MLTRDLVLVLWSKTYNTQGKPDWAHILPYYYDNVYFRVLFRKYVGSKNLQR
jgi:hypothetical protein